MLIVLTTVRSLAEAESLAHGIVSERLAGCVQILPQVTSIYEWEGAVQQETEHLLLIKTIPEKWQSLHDHISANHSYSVPEVVSINVDSVSEPYKHWLQSVINK